MSRNTVTQYADTSRVLQEKQKDANGNGFSWKTVGREHGRVEITVDFGQIVEMLGYRALKAKSGKSQFMHGAVTVSVVRGSRKAVKS